MDEALCRNRTDCFEWFFTDTTILYVRKSGNGALEYGSEPAVRFWGEVSLTRLADTPDEHIKLALDSLADALGDTLGQELVTIGYRDETWVRSRVDTAGTA